MKLNYKIFFILLFLFFSCNNEQINFLKVIPAKFLFTEGRGSLQLSIKTDDLKWKIKNPANSWILFSDNLSKIKKEILKFTVNTKIIFDTLNVFAGYALQTKMKVGQKESEFFKSCDLLNFSLFTNSNEWQILTDNKFFLNNPVKESLSGTKISVSTLKNNSYKENSQGKIFINVKNDQQDEITVNQSGQFFPSYNLSPLPPDTTGMKSNANQIVKKMKIGWNLGNTLEAIGGETAWGNPVATKELINLVKRSGFNAIRIPCSWFQYMVDTNTSQINLSWLKRVKEVVQYCVDNDMYVILNIHWDGGWLEKNCTIEKQLEVKARQKTFWEQIATFMRDFDEHLLFASANEPDVKDSIQMSVLNSYHQAFIDAVRSTGGKNYYRVLVIQGPSTDIELTNQLMNSLPRDVVNDRLIIEIHYYTPYQFCLMTEDANWGKMFYYWGKDYHSLTMPERNATWGEESTMCYLFGLMKTKFIDKGIPVIIGEFGVIKRSNLTGDDLKLHLASRAYYLKFLTQQAKNYGMVPFYWDSGNMGHHIFALFDRFKNVVYDSLALNALMEGIEK